jgi:glucose-6-phosphate 1-dehydrogenase
VKKLVIFIVFVNIVVGCSITNESSNSKLLAKHYTALIQELNKGNLKLTKYIIKGEKRDTIYLDTVNWEQELSLFLESDISKNKINQYKITSFADSCKFLFQTTSNKQSVKKLNYAICNNDLIVNIDVEKRSELYDFVYYLELTPNGYLIEAKQKVSMTYESNYIIEGKFRK